MYKVQKSVQTDSYRCYTPSHKTDTMRVTARLLYSSDGLCLSRAPFLLMPSSQSVLCGRNLESDPCVQLILLPRRRFLYPLEKFSVSNRKACIVW